MLGKLVVGAVLASVLGLLTAAHQHFDRRDDPLKVADKAFSDHEYQKALENYRSAAKDSQFAAERPRVEVRIGVCLARLSKFDEAIAHLKAFVEQRPAPLAEARARLERGVIAATMPHYFYEKDGQRSRGTYIQGGTYVWAVTDDMTLARTDLEASTAIFAAQVANATPTPNATDKGLSAEHLRAHLELGSVLEAFRDHGLAFNVSGDVQQDQKLETAWNDRIVGAFDGAISHQVAVANQDGEALARYMKGAACLRMFTRSTARDVRSADEILVAPLGGDKPTVAVPADRNPVKVLSEAFARCATSALGDEILVSLAKAQETLGLLVDAVASYRKLVADFPKSPWIGDAKSAIEQITFPRLSIAAGEPRLPGKPFELTAHSRNMKAIAVTLRPVKLPSIYLSDGFLSDDDLWLGTTSGVIKGLPSGFEATTPAVTLTADTRDDGRHVDRETALAIAGLPAGCYVLEARGEGLQWNTLVQVSDVGIITKQDNDRTIVFVVDRVTGSPLRGADVAVRERYYSRGLFGSGWKVRYSKGTTDERGIFERAHSVGPGESFQIEVFAADGERCAFTHRNYAYRQNEAADTTTAYVMTDRPVYRPEDPIRFASIIRTRHGNEYTAIADTRFKVSVHAPNGQHVMEQELRTDESGAFKQELVLGKEPPLGVYVVQVQRGNEYVAQGHFRVEEYLKPEFKVTVGLPTEQVRFGTRVNATVEAQYFFGGAVAGGRVEWKVFRTGWWPWFGRRGEYDYLFGSDAWIRPRHEQSGRELVASGSGVLDGSGKLPIGFETGTEAANPGDGSRFLIEAQVTDESRRTLDGSGSLLVTKRALSLDVTPKQNFYLAGENVECEIHSRLPAGTPVAVEGKVRVYRIDASLDEKGGLNEARTVVHETAVKTDDEGRAFFRWVADAPGNFAIAFEALDRFEQLVTGESRLWVHKPGFGARDFAMKNVELIPNRRTFKVGEKALVLVTSNFADGTLLLSMDGGRRMLKCDVVKLDGKLAVIEIPIERTHVPNFHVHVASVRGGEYFEDEVEIFVPPVEQFLNVTATFDRPDYRPGASGDLVVTTRDDAGNPVSARAAVTVLDASILEIQSDTTPDIRRFFWGSRRGHDVARNSSARSAFDGELVRNVAWGRYDVIGALPAWSNMPGIASRVLEGVGFGALEFEHIRGRLRDGRPAGEKGDRGGGRGSFAGDDKATAVGLAAAPAPTSAARAEEKADHFNRELKDQDSSEDDSNAREPGQAGPAPKVRSDFRDSALWTADVTTDETGRAVVKVPFPESLTTWRAKVWAWTADTRVGEITADTKTTKDLLVRLRAPRFFVEGDQITVTALVNNRTAVGQAARVRIELDGQVLTTQSALEQATDVPPGEARRIDWLVGVQKPGRTKITVTALGLNDSDAMVKEFTAIEWGHDKRIPRNAVLSGDAEQALTFTIPSERHQETTRLDVTLNPSLALTLLDALPYLIDYPYGCTEQTMSRFMPAVAVSRVLGELGTTLDEVAKARQTRGMRDRATDHKPIVTQAALDSAVRDGLARLASMQNGDGGFGWWRADQSSSYLTAYVLCGLVAAGEADLPVPAGMIDRAVAFLAAQAPKEQKLVVATYIAYALAKARHADAALLARIYTNRDDLTPYGKALLASAFASAKDTEHARLVLSNLADFAKVDRDGGTAHWQSESRDWWWWWNNLVETNAAVLNAFVDVDPKHELVEPLVKWLVTNRRGGQWLNTRDTAQAVEALVRYARASGQLEPDLDVTVSLKGGGTHTVHVGRENLLTFQNTLSFGAGELSTGDATLTVRTHGKGRIYVSADATFFTKEADIAAAGEDLLVERAYVRVTSKAVERSENGRTVVTTQESFEPLANGATVASGDVIEVWFKIDAKNDYDYLLFEDLKPAGFEALEVRSGPQYGAGICSNVEFRDAKTAFFVTWLQQGTHTLKYRLRAELPGTLKARPGRGEAMYAPAISGTTSSFRFTVKDGPEGGNSK